MLLTNETVWRDTLGELEHQMSKATFNSWLRDAQLVESGNGRAVIAVRNEYARDWLDGRLRETIERTLSAVAEREMVIEFVVEGEAIAVPNGNGRHYPPEPEFPPELDLDLPTESVPPPDFYKNGKGGIDTESDRAEIEIFSADPTSWFFKVSHYAQRFWRPYLGMAPFALWELLGSYYYFVKMTDAKWPTIEMLADSLGYGNRYTILGRAEAKGRKAQEGAIDVLIRERLVYYWTVGTGRRVAYKFRVRDDLKMLTPHQVRQLSPRKQAEHAEYIRYFKDFEVEDWEKITAKSAYKDNLQAGKPLMSKT